VGWPFRPKGDADIRGARTDRETTVSAVSTQVGIGLSGGVCRKSRVTSRKGCTHRRGREARYVPGQPGRRSRGRPLVIVVLAGVVVRLRFLAAEAEMPDEGGMAGCHQWDPPPRRGPGARKLGSPGESPCRLMIALLMLEPFQGAV
jgi:hypothetical protein